MCVFTIQALIEIALQLTQPTWTIITTPLSYYFIPSFFEHFLTAGDEQSVVTHCDFAVVMLSMRSRCVTPCHSNV